MDRNRGAMLAVFTGMLESLGGAFKRYEAKEEKKKDHSTERKFLHFISTRLRPARDGDYIQSPTGWRSQFRRTPKKQRSKMKREAKRKRLEKLTSVYGFGLAEAIRIQRRERQPRYAAGVSSHHN